ncbi:MAG: hypothetical protein K9N23_07245 [Akkermansiaceae bacterium]|nr:hypothetical protein [Akkermansiaceae bacterium]
MDVGSRRFLNLRMLILAEVCPHCARTDTLKAHGFVKAACGSIRGIRLYQGQSRQSRQRRNVTMRGPHRLTAFNN